jgi:uncharacterized membrane protein YoaK (UPF0700 family)
VTTEHHHHLSGTLAVAAVLAVLAGFVDAFVYLRVAPVFVANMSGNLVHLGMGTGEADGHAVGAACAALGAFIAGVIAAVFGLDARLRSGRRASGTRLLFAEAALLACMPIAMWSFDISYSASIRPLDYWVVVPGSMAMGVQAIALRRVGQIAVATTYGTGAIVRFGEKLALAARRAPRAGDTRRTATIVVLGTVLVAYVGGAALAAALDDSPLLLVAATAVPLGVALVERRNPGVDDGAAD